ncbi:UDP-glycosyltransferase 73C5-like [Neltuma alba]|uniref:UDP-glycosyltransferase 73C5-like n=1 Tax=Neltuma alba TaxID=207710 RepID=UPI0010A2D146|nr:UDP-glycosyltransferase 73C5-like [Prosopis alba]
MDSLSQDQEPQLHAVLFPLMAQGHMIPMVDIARILASRNIIITLVSTPRNADRFASILSRSSHSGLQIRVVQLQFPYKEAGVAEGCENLDMLPSLRTAMGFFEATSLLQEPVEKLFQDLTPTPSFIISDMCLPYTSYVANKFNIPRISFVGTNCFCLLCAHHVRHNDVRNNITSESEYFILPGIPDRIEMNKAQLSGPFNGWKEFSDQIFAAEKDAHGIIMNSFEELEPAYAREYKKVRGGKMWCIGPVSLINKSYQDKAERGNKASIDEFRCMKWLDLQKSNTVIYACLGSLCNLTWSQLTELGLALEASNRPFIWVIREGNESKELNKWIEEYGFEERTKARGLVIRGWAPQVLILSHPAIGGFITHCGWNSTLEAICGGVPMVTWPLFGDQFCNEKLVVQILQVAVSVGVESPMIWGEENKIGVLVKKEDIEKAIDKLMDETEEGEERRRRARKLAEMAKNAVEEGGSSYSNVDLLIQDIMHQINKDK